MICQATYDSLDAIPESLREEFEQKNGKWQLKDDAIPGVGPLFNGALAANSERQLTQLATKKTKIAELEREMHTLQDKLSVVDTPGSKVLSKDDAALFESYTRMGTPKEIGTKLTEHTTLQTKVKDLETKETMQKLAASGGINPDVLFDWASSSEDLHFFVKSAEQSDGKGGKVTVDVPFVRIETKNGDKVEITERELLPFAKETLPEWKYTALTTTAPGEKQVTPPVPRNNGGVIPQNNGMRVPNLSSAQSAPVKDSAKKRPVDKFNEERAAKTSPFAKPLPVPAVGGSMGRMPS